MPWFKVDDTFAMHPKVLMAGNSAVGLWVRAGSWSMQQLTDGRVPTLIARQFGSPADAKRLVDTGLWVEVDDGYEFHQWAERQPSRRHVEAERTAAAERKRKSREKRLSERDTG
jgi:hypothetical protein